MHEFTLQARPRIHHNPLGNGIWRYNSFLQQSDRKAHSMRKGGLDRSTENFAPTVPLCHSGVYQSISLTLPYPQLVDDMASSDLGPRRLELLLLMTDDRSKVSSSPRPLVGDASEEQIAASLCSTAARDTIIRETPRQLVFTGAPEPRRGVGWVLVTAGRPPLPKVPLASGRFPRLSFLPFCASLSFSALALFWARSCSACS